MTQRIRQTESFLKDFFENSRYFSEDPKAKNYRFEHSVRVANLCKEIAKREDMDAEAATIAGLLHDVAYGADVPGDYDWKEHGRDSARIARPFLESLGLPGDTVNDICMGIAIHVDDRADFQWRRTPFAETIGDADNIDRFDAYRIYESVRYQMEPEVHTLPEKLEWLDRRLTQLEQLGRMEFGTETATAMWREKVEFQAAFFKRLQAQMKLSALSEEQED